MIRGRIRPAHPREAATLSRLAMRSKAHWGYDRAFLDACEHDLTIAPDRCDGVHLHVLECDGDVTGFFELVGAPPIGELANLWVDPARIRQGIGRTLWNAALAQARALGFRELTIDADPHAEAFYLRMGAERVGESPSTVDPDRLLPLLQILLKPGGS